MGEETELLEELEPEIVRNLDPLYQRLLEIWRKAKSRQEKEESLGDV